MEAMIVWVVSWFLKHRIRTIQCYHTAPCKLSSCNILFYLLLLNVVNDAEENTQPNRTTLYERNTHRNFTWFGLSHVKECDEKRNEINQKQPCCEQSKTVNVKKVF